MSTTRIRPGVSTVPAAPAPAETPVKTRVQTRVETPAHLMQALAANPTLTLAEVAAAIGKATSTMERAGAKLGEQGRLRFVGPRKGAKAMAKAMGSGLNTVHLGEFWRFNRRRKVNFWRRGTRSFVGRKWRISTFDRSRVDSPSTAFT